MGSTHEMALMNIIEAWDKLAGGHHSVRTVQTWLINDMKPAVDECRAALAISPQPVVTLPTNESE